MTFSCPKSFITYIFLIVPPQFTISPPPTKTINEGQDLTIDCAASGTPTPNVTWVQVLNNDNIINKGVGSSTLSILNIQRPAGSSGNHIYECQAKNIPTVAAVKKQTEIIVHCKYWHVWLIFFPKTVLLLMCTWLIAKSIVFL